MFLTIHLPVALFVIMPKLPQFYYKFVIQTTFKMFEKLWKMQNFACATKLYQCQSF